MDLQFSIETGKKDVERAKATIADEEAKIGAAEAKIEELSTSIATAEKDLASATEIREKENADFVKLEKELMESISMLERAIAIIEREMAKTGFVQGGAAMKKISDALEGVVTAAGVNTADRAKITALLQAQSGDEDLALELQPGGAPDPAAYKSKSGGIVSVLEDMLEKAKGELAAAQKAEMNSKFDYDMLKQKLEDMMANADKVMDETKKAKAAAEEAKAIAQGELDTASKTLSDSETHLKDLQQECMAKAEEYETSQHSRSEELTALDTAKKVLVEKTAGAAEREYSFIQVSAKTRVGVRAKQAKDDVLNLIQGLAAKEAAHKAFCDKEMKETKAKKEDKETDIEDLTTKIDKATAKIAKLTEEIATLEEELGAIAKAQKEADKIRAEEKAAWADAKADYESGIEGVGMALKVLRDYYAEKEEALLQAQHDKATGAASGIIGMLEVVESDFTKSLAEGTAKEAMAQEEYEKLTQDNKIATTEKETAVKYKTKDKKETEEMLVSLKDDKATVEKEYAAVMEYWEELQGMCIAKPEPYAERKRRREAEIAGLKQALTILEEEAGSAFLQIRTARRA